MSADANPGGMVERVRARLSAFRSATPPFWITYFSHVWQLLKHGVPMLLLLLAISLVIHHKYLLERTEAFFAEVVAAYRTVSERPSIPERRDVLVLELSANARLNKLQRIERLSEATIQRLRGVRPIDRSKMASLLNHVAMKLATTDAKPQVVAIDVDLAPLEDCGPQAPGKEGGSCQSEREIIDALNALRKHAHVVVIAWHREAAHQQRRNQFMVGAECTTSSRAPVNANTAHMHKLYFASPQVFAKEGQVVINFPKKYKGPDGTSSDALYPPFYPSLGTLTYLASNGLSSASAEQLSEDELKTLTALCDQAQAGVDENGNAALLEDLFAETAGSGTGGEKIAERYHETLYNWRLLDSTKVKATIVDDIAEAEFDARAVILGVGGMHDEFDLPSGRASGAMVHAVQALSYATPLETASDSRMWFGRVFPLVVDAGIGLAFVIFTALAIPAFSRLQRTVPAFGGFLLAAFPAGLAVLLIYASVQIAAHAVDMDQWINPIYLIVGLAVHAYVEVSRTASNDSHNLSWPQSFSFGRYVLCRALAEHRAGRAPVPKLIDAAVSMAIQWLILAIGAVTLVASLSEPFSMAIQWLIRTVGLSPS